MDNEPRFELPQEFEDRICKGCGKTFRPSTHNQMFCCAPCRKEHSPRKSFTDYTIKGANIDFPEEPSNHDKIKEIAKLAREKGMSYGQYVSSCGAMADLTKISFPDWVKPTGRGE